MSPDGLEAFQSLERNLERKAKSDPLVGVSLADALDAELTAPGCSFDADQLASVVFAWFRANRSDLSDYCLTDTGFNALLDAAQQIGQDDE